MRYGARVFFKDDGVIQIIQTVKDENNRQEPYRADSEDGNNKEDFANPGEGQAERVLEILRAAQQGELVARKTPVRN